MAEALSLAAALDWARQRIDAMEARVLLCHVAAVSHATLKGFGEEAQRRLAAARVLVIGAGGLGSASVPYLAGAGVGTIGIVDDDVVELSNLHRQIAHGTADIGRPKAASLAEHRAQGRERRGALAAPDFLFDSRRFGCRGEVAHRDSSHALMLLGRAAARPRGARQPPRRIAV